MNTAAQAKRAKATILGAMAHILRTGFEGGVVPTADSKAAYDFLNEQYRKVNYAEGDRARRAREARQIALISS